MSEHRDLGIMDSTQEIENTQPLGRPLINPEVFTGDKDFNEWIQHFKSMAAGMTSQSYNGCTFM